MLRDLYLTSFVLQGVCYLTLSSLFMFINWILVVTEYLDMKHFQHQ